jgi:hypothetical protein
MARYRTVDRLVAAGEACLAVELHAVFEVGADRLRVGGAEFGAPRGLQAHLQQGQIARAVALGAGHEVVHERRDQGTVLGGRHEFGQDLGVRGEAFVEVGVDLAEQVVAAGEVVRGRAHRDPGLAVHRAERQPACPLARQHLHTGVDQGGPALRIARHAESPLLLESRTGDPRKSPLQPLQVKHYEWSGSRILRKETGLRKLTYFIACSIDGFIGDPSGDADR